MKELAWAFVLLPFIITGSMFIYGNGVFREGIYCYGHWKNGSHCNSYPALLNEAYNGKN